MAESPKSTSLPSANEQEKEDRQYLSELPSNPEEVEILRRDSAVNPLVAFTFDELKEITGNFRQENILGGGGFGIVYKGLITENFIKGLESVQVAAKVHDGDNSLQGHREWLVAVSFQLHSNISFFFIH